MLKHGSLAVAVVQRQVMVVQGMNIGFSITSSPWTHVQLLYQPRVPTISVSDGWMCTPTLLSASESSSPHRSLRLASLHEISSPSSPPMTLPASPSLACLNWPHRPSPSTWSSARAHRSGMSNSSTPGRPSHAVVGSCSERPRLRRIRTYYLLSVATPVTSSLTSHLSSSSSSPTTRFHHCITSSPILLCIFTLLARSKHTHP